MSSFLNGLHRERLTQNVDSKTDWKRYMLSLNKRTLPKYLLYLNLEYNNTKKESIYTYICFSFINAVTKLKELGAGLNSVQLLNVMIINWCMIFYIL